MKHIFLVAGAHCSIMGIYGVYRGATPWTYANLITGLVYLIIAFILSNVKRK